MSLRNERKGTEATSMSATDSLQPGRPASAEAQGQGHALERRHVVIVNLQPLDAVEEEACVIVPLAAEAGEEAHG